MSNYIPDTNSFSLPTPPQWWLTQLSDLDSALVVFPSRLRMAYVLARKRSASLSMPAMVKLDNDLLRTTAGGDGDFMANNNLVFVGFINNPFGTWNDSVIQELRARDITAAGGAEKFIEKLEDAEAALAVKKRANMIEDIGFRARDAWRSYQARTGQRNQHANATFGHRSKVTWQHVGKLGE
jgi:hypothetical protein